MRRAILVWPLLLLAVLLTACGTSGPGTVPWDRPSAPAGTSLTDLHNVGELQARFTQDMGKPRLVLLVSPT
jgi:predicted small lipoprotein YifL